MNKELLGKYGVQFMEPTREWCPEFSLSNKSNFDCSDKWIMTTIHKTREQAEAKASEVKQHQSNVRIVITDEDNLKTF